MLRVGVNRSWVGSGPHVSQGDSSRSFAHFWGVRMKIKLKIKVFNTHSLKLERGLGVKMCALGSVSESKKVQRLH